MCSNLNFLSCALSILFHDHQLLSWQVLDAEKLGELNWRLGSGAEIRQVNQ